MDKKVVLTGRDVVVLELIKKFGWVREDLLAKFLGVDYVNKEKVMQNLGYRLSKGSFVKRQKIMQGIPSYWGLAKKGADFIDGTVEKKVQLIFLRHNDLVTTLAVQFALANEKFITEYELKKTKSNKKLPDLIVGNNAIEIEISQKNNARLSSIVANYVVSNYEKIIYYIDNKVIANKINDLAGEYKHKFQFMLFKDKILEAQLYNPVAPSKQPTHLANYNNSFENKLKELNL